MGIIHVLSPQMANLIAAGEVVERPGSVVKEIIENAVDAGSTRIEVEIKNGGVTYIRVSDNGCGISPEDVPRAFLRHATSKIREPRDMAAIGTMGFRGEALAAISAVAKVDIFTRTPHRISGVQMTCEGGEAGEPTETGCPQGTTVVIRDLFYNVPARMKFLKKDATEGAYCESAVQAAALANPHISFKFIKDGRESFFTPGNGDLRQVIAALCGKDVAAALIPVLGSFPEVEINGFVSQVSETRSSRSMQYFLVNGRPVKGKILTAAIDGAYKGHIMPGRHPMCFLNFKVPLSAVDVNVHPAKLEVKFAHEKAIFSAIHNTVTLALEGHRGFPELRLEEKKKDELPPVEKTKDKPAEKPRGFGDYGGVRVERSGGKLSADEGPADDLALAAPARTLTHAPESLPFEFDDSMFNMDSRHLVPPRKGPSAYSDSKPAYKAGRGAERSKESPDQEIIEKVMKLAAIEPIARAVVQKAASEYLAPSVQRDPLIEAIPAEPARKPMPEAAVPEAAEANLLADAGGGIRVIGMAFNTYILVQEGESLWMIDKHAAHEKLLYNELRANIGAQDIQTLLLPVSVNLTAAEKQACLDNRGLLEQCGFEIDDFGLSGLAVRGAPTYLDEQDIPFVLSEMAEKLAAGFDTESSILDDLLASISCKAAIKGGSHSDPVELQRLAEQVLSLPDVRNCPHGRPVAVSMSRYQLEKQFKRVL